MALEIEPSNVERPTEEVGAGEGNHPRDYSIWFKRAFSPRFRLVSLIFRCKFLDTHLCGVCNNCLRVAIARLCWPKIVLINAIPSSRLGPCTRSLALGKA